MSQYDGTVWSNYFWYPKGLSWEQVEDAIQNGAILARPKDLQILPVFIIGVTLVRYFFQFIVAKPIARYLLGDTANRTPPEPCPELEKVFKKSQNPPKDLTKLFRKFSNQFILKCLDF